MTLLQRPTRPRSVATSQLPIEWSGLGSGWVNVTSGFERASSESGIQAAVRWRYTANFQRTDVLLKGSALSAERQPRRRARQAHPRCLLILDLYRSRDYADVGLDAVAW